MARQPIFDRWRSIYGYELLFRSGRENFFQHDDHDEASSRTIDSAMNILGLTHLTRGHRAFINVTRRLLVEDLYTVLAPTHTVIELVETVEPDEQVIEACRRLKKKGYLLALDDFVYDERFEPLMRLADIVKVDFLTTTPAQREQMVELCTHHRACLLAEKVETREGYDQAFAMGYSYFQGYYFCKPQIVVGRELPGLKRNYLRFLQLVNQRQLDFDQIEQALKQDVSLSVRLLRYLNSAAMGVRHEISSIRQALIMLGERPLRKWASLIALTGLGQDKTAELIVTCLARAQFGELIAPDAGLSERALDLFLMGMLSVIDALLDQPMPEILEQIPLAPDVAAALMGGSTSVSQIYRLVMACEAADWTTVRQLSESLGIDESRVGDVYKQAIAWADDVIRF